MAQSHLQPPRGLSVVVAVLAARRAQELAPGIPWWLLWRFRRSPGRAGRLLWGFLGDDEDLEGRGADQGAGGRPAAEDVEPPGLLHGPERG